MLEILLVQNAVILKITCVRNLGKTFIFFEHLSLEYEVRYISEYFRILDFVVRNLRPGNENIVGP